MIQPVILEKLEKLSETLQIEVLHYIDLLLEKHAENVEHQEVLGQHSLTSAIKGTFMLPLPNDFDECNVTDSDCQAAYEKNYGYGSLAGKMIISDDFDEPLEDLKDYM